MKTACALLIVLAYSAVAQTTPRSTVQATGDGSVSVTPDQARINVSVVTQAANAQDAANQNAGIATTVIGQLTQVLGESGSVKTVNYSITPIYQNSPNQPSTLTGYSVTNSIQVTLNDLTITGKVIDTATQAGASRIDSLQFSLKDDSAARSQALSAATRKAKSKAEAIAASVGLRTGAIFLIQESGAILPLGVFTGAPTSVLTTPVQPGQLTVTANVTMSVELIQ